jgi:N-acetylmuramoyl-L-alanine amidase
MRGIDRGTRAAAAATRPDVSGALAAALGCVLCLIAVAAEGSPRGRPAAAREISVPPGRAVVERIAWQSTAEGGELVVDVRGSVKYSTHVAPADPAAGLPPRSYLDLRPATMGAALARSPVAVDDALLRRIRVGQFDRETVRIVVDLAEPAFFRVRTTEQPPQIFLSLQRGGEENATEAELAAGRRGGPTAGPGEPVPTAGRALASQPTPVPTAIHLAASAPSPAPTAVHAAPGPSARTAPPPTPVQRPAQVPTPAPTAPPVVPSTTEPAAKLGGEAPHAAPTPRPNAVGKPVQSSRRYTVVLDPGHGGKDPGAQGVGGYEEKNITLTIAGLVAERLHGDERIRVLLTRNDDSFVSLEQRTAIANAQGADLFISIHVNASETRELAGIETYTLNNTNDRATIRLAALENGLTLAGASPGERDLAYILSDLVQTGKEDESIALARAVHGELFSYVHSRWSDVTSLGVKKGPFYVLVGAYMPCVLVEVGFLTNEREGQRIVGKRYQQDVAEGIAHGIRRFLATAAANSNL